MRIASHEIRRGLIGDLEHERVAAVVETHSRVTRREWHHLEVNTSNGSAHPPSYLVIREAGDLGDFGFLVIDKLRANAIAKCLDVALRVICASREASNR